MAMAVKFFKCAHCGNVIVKLVDSGVPVVCCGEKMQELIPNTVDASAEKHVPHVVGTGERTMRIEIGNVHHPMTPEHHIAFIYVETDKGGIMVNLKDEPVAEVCLCSAKPLAVYEYCNLHGLWKKDLI
jgi:superoxide reductase